jgi:hypothetical protein
MFLLKNGFRALTADTSWTLDSGKVFLSNRRRINKKNLKKKHLQKIRLKVSCLTFGLTIREIKKTFQQI